jgi:hypothetical protein
LFKTFAEWISSTQLSAVFTNNLWVVPASQSVHIISIGILFSCAILINLRVLGIGPAGRSVVELTGQLAPWMWRALAALVLTGAVQTIAEPQRQFGAQVFWAKMLMVLLVVPLTVAFVRTVRRGGADWSVAASPPPAARAFAICSTLLWCAIVVCGRLIGYSTHSL